MGLLKASVSLSVFSVNIFKIFMLLTFRPHLHTVKGAWRNMNTFSILDHLEIVIQDCDSFGRHLRRSWEPKSQHSTHTPCIGFFHSLYEKKENSILNHFVCWLSALFKSRFTLPGLRCAASFSWTGWSSPAQCPVPKLAYIYTPAARVAILLGVLIDGVVQTLAATNVLILRKTRVFQNSDSAVFSGFKSLLSKSTLTFLPQERPFLV